MRFFYKIKKDFVEGVGSGFLKGIGSTFEGLYNMVVHPLDTLGGLATLAGTAVVGYSSPGIGGSPQERLQAFDGFFGTNLADVDAGVKQSLSETWDTLQHGSDFEQGEIVGQAIEFVAEIAVGTKGAGAALKSVKAGSMGSKMAKIAGIADKVGEILKATGGKLKKWTLGKLKNAKKGIFGKKPLNAPNIEKWMKKGGKVETLEDGTWRYTDWEGNVVDYKNGHPDFSPHSRQSVDIGEQKGNYTSDYKDAQKASKKVPPKLSNEETVWHHNEDGKTMQEVDRTIHERFTHNGGVSASKSKVAFGKK